MMEQTGLGDVPPGEVPARRSRVPWVLLGVLLAMLASTFWLGVQNDSIGEEGIFIIAAVFAIVSYEVVGATVASRAPHNPIGWLLLLVGFTFQAGALTDEVLTHEFYARRTDSFVFGTALWFQSWLFAGIAALTAQARKAAVPTTVTAVDIGRFPSDVEAAVYFCTLEALNNAAKYAQASAVEVWLERSNGHLSFSILDDGRGFDPDVTSYGTGLQGMADRLEAAGGSLDITTAPGEGVRVAGRLPVAEGRG